MEAFALYATEEYFNQTKAYYTYRKGMKRYSCIIMYRKPPTIIYFRKRFFMGLYKGGGGLIYEGAYTWKIFCVSNKQVRHKQVSHKQGNKRVLSSDYWAYIYWGTYIRVGLYSGGGGGLIFGMR